MPRKIIISSLIVLLILGMAYYIKTNYYYPGHNFIGIWKSGDNIIKISHEGNNFIFKWSAKPGAQAARYNGYELQLITHPEPSNRIIYFDSDDAIQFGTKYYKRAQ